MHAASVHPEPGSNSRMFVFNLAYASSNHFECYLSFSYFCLSCICSLRNFRVPFLHILYACTSLFVVQFSMTVSLPFSRQLCYYITSLSICQYFFQSFFDFFQVFCDMFLPPQIGDLHIISHRLIFVNTFFEIFQKFFHSPKPPSTPII